MISRIVRAASVAGIAASAVLAAFALASAQAPSPKAKSGPPPKPAPASAVAAAPVPSDRKNPFLGAKSWAYQLTNLGVAQRKRIMESDYDLVVVDYAWEKSPGGDEVPLTREEVAAMQKKPDGSRRLIIAYLSIGESENNRYYWRPEWHVKRPAWMKGESKEWKGNYPVEYWNPTWQQIIYGNPQSYVDRIVAAGFDGFYIDRADSYYVFGDTKLARDRMADFFVKLVNYIRSKQPGAGVMVQNAEELLERPAFMASIDAIAKEDLLYGINGEGLANDSADVTASLHYLKLAQKSGRPVLVVEYLSDRKVADDARRKLAAHGFISYFAPRDLGRLNVEF